MGKKSNSSMVQYDVKEIIEGIYKKMTDSEEAIIKAMKDGLDKKADKWVEGSLAEVRKDITNTKTKVFWWIVPGLFALVFTLIGVIMWPIVTSKLSAIGNIIADKLT